MKHALLSVLLAGMIGCGKPDPQITETVRIENLQAVEALSYAYGVAATKHWRDGGQNGCENLALYDAGVRLLNMNDPGTFNTEELNKMAGMDALRKDCSK